MRPDLPFVSASAFVQLDLLITFVSASRRLFQIIIMSLISISVPSLSVVYGEIFVRTCSIDNTGVSGV